VILGGGVAVCLLLSAHCAVIFAIVRQITTRVLHHSIFYGPDALPDAQPTASKHWRQAFLSVYLFGHSV